MAIYARKLVEQGHDITVISQPAPHHPRWRLALRRLLGRPPLRVFKPSPLLDFLGANHIILDRCRPVTNSDVPEGDAIIATWWETAEWVAGLSASKGVKAYLIQGYEVFGTQPRNRVAATYALPLHKFAVSSFVRDALMTRHGCKEVELLPNSVDLEQFNAPVRARGTPFTVGFLYTANPIKDVGLAISALEQVRHSLPDIEAMAFGARAPKDDLPLPDWVTYHLDPPQDRIAALYSNCDLWLFTSKEEGFGLPLLEAMACRTPVLATRAGAAPDLIDGTNGVLLDSDADAFAAEIIRMAQLSDLQWKTCSDTAYKTAHSYSWDDAAKRLARRLSEIS
ncbi:glycosyltransferase involved in cell wall biosynthesis [Litoreibacter meonggei]|uniref:Glycosyltransferase involved in cell wall biosynthesis n=1 Tax=Litoreibacter meonggei TaxID=1049199 RepID=A0A497V1Y0_9RHOB|nr:glycosyltransferase involved in cell wall biosynthesis [Litoreibacter meonggei]